MPESRRSIGEKNENKWECNPYYKGYKACFCRKLKGIKIYVIILLFFYVGF